MAEAQRHTLGVGSQTLAGSDTTGVVAIDLVHRKGKQKYLKLKVTQRSRHTSRGSEDPPVRGAGGTKPRPWLRGGQSGLEGLPEGSPPPGCLDLSLGASDLGSSAGGEGAGSCPAPPTASGTKQLVGGGAPAVRCSQGLRSCLLARLRCCPAPGTAIGVRAETAR